MEIIRTNRLNSEQRKDILAMVQACQKECGTALSFPLEDSSLFYLLYDPCLVSALSLEWPAPDGAEGDIPLECRAFTKPEVQRQGYFSKLLEAACEDAGEQELLFIMDHSNAGAIFTLTSLEAELLEDHYKMELALDAFQEVFPETDNTGNHLYMRVDSNENSYIFTFYLKEDKSNPMGAACAACYETSVCLHDFELSPTSRGQGLGEEALRLFISHIKKSEIVSLFLHVVGDNLPAVNLYKKTGFRITETLSFYLY